MRTPFIYLAQIDLTKLGPRDYENIVNEIKSQSEMQDENIVNIVDFMKKGKMIYILLDFVEGGNLFYYLTKNHPIPQTDIARFFAQTCKAIHHVHSKNYIHRDLKPENILIDCNLNAKLCDFGWCTSINDLEYR